MEPPHVTTMRATSLYFIALLLCERLYICCVHWDDHTIHFHYTETHQITSLHVYIYV